MHVAQMMILCCTAISTDPRDRGLLLNVLEIPGSNFDCQTQIPSVKG